MSLNEGKNKTGLNVDGDGSVGWGEGDSETQREVMTADEKVEDEKKMTRAQNRKWWQ